LVADHPGVFWPRLISHAHCVSIGVFAAIGGLDLTFFGGVIARAAESLV
jgi:hypothetical protein